MRTNRFVTVTGTVLALFFAASRLVADPLLTDHLPAPVANCQNTLVVNLEVNGTRTLSASAFDGGSFDLNGGPLWFKVRRVNPASPCSSDTLFRSQITFCCAEAGDTILVQLRVYNIPLDTSGVAAGYGLNNADDCTVTIIVRENVAPVFEPPMSLQLSCDQYLNGPVSFPVINENCCLDTVFYQDNFFNYDTLCRTGIIIRRFTARDCSGNTATIGQSLLVGNEQYYGVRFPGDTLVNSCEAVAQLPPPAILYGGCERMIIQYTDSIFYQNLDVDACYLIRRTWRLYNQCQYNPNIGLIRVPNPQPDSNWLSDASREGPTVAPMMTSTIAALTPGSTPTDFNQYWDFDVNGYLYTQLIWVRDSVQPNAVNRMNATFCDVSGNNPQFWSGGNWFDPITGVSDLREMPINIRMLTYDACDKDEVHVQFQLFLDLDANGTPETVVSETNSTTPGFILYNNLNSAQVEQRQFDRRLIGIDEKYRFALSKTMVNDSVVCSVQWNTTASPNVFTPVQLPYGFHRIEWSVTDQCGNITTQQHSFTVSNDCLAPTINCLESLDLPLSADTSLILPLDDVLIDAIDNITWETNLAYTIEKQPFSNAFSLGMPSVDSVVFDCDDIGFPPVRVWVRDQAGNSAFCQVFISISDSLGLCQSDATAIRGQSRTITGVPMPNIQYMLSNIGDTIPIAQTTAGTNGLYYFNALMPFGNYRVEPRKTSGSWLNGVNTFDFILISRHLLGIEMFDTPYKIIAADINNSGTLSTFDVVTARQVLLGVRDTFTNNQSWRFVASNYVFPQPNNPAAFTVPSWRFLTNQIGIADSVNFLAIKVGDLDYDMSPNESTEIDERDLPIHMDWIIGTPEAVENGQWRTPIWVQPHRDLAAIQGALRLKSGRMFQWDSPWLKSEFIYLTNEELRFSFDEILTQSNTPIWTGWLYTDTPSGTESFDWSATNLSTATFTSDGTKGAIALLSGTTPSPVSPVDRISIRPNPFGSTLTLYQDFDAATWQIFDAQGRLMLRVHSGAEAVQVSTAHWPDGVYWLRCDSQWGTKQLKLFHQ
jgi:hypothetical protein